MTLLLDTHALIWHLEGSDALPTAARHAIQDKANRVVVSVASLWEIAIKKQLGKLELALDFPDEMVRELDQNGIGRLAIEPAHLRALIGLPMHHRDPFDRLLIAQAIAERMNIVSRDPSFDRYGVARTWET